MARFDPELHPRGEEGLFSEKGAGLVGAAREIERQRRAIDVQEMGRLRQLQAGPYKPFFGKKSDTAALAEYRRARAETQHLDAEGRVPVPQSRTWIDHLEGMPKYTWQAHWQSGADGKPVHPDDGGKPTPERAKLHAKITDKFFTREDGTKKKPTPAGKQRIAVLTMGAPASGKSSVVKDLVKDNNFVKVDPDAIKDELPEYKTALKASARDAAAMAHDESSYLAKQVRRRAMDEGYMLMVDGTGTNAAAYKQLIGDLQDRGYHVTVVMADLDEETGMERMLSRAEDCGRYVPPAIVKGAYRSIPGNFEEIARTADAFQLWDTRGAIARPVWTGAKDQEDAVHVEARVVEFKARAHAQRWRREPPASDVRSKRASPTR